MRCKWIRSFATTACLCDKLVGLAHCMFMSLKCQKEEHLSKASIPARFLELWQKKKEKKKERPCVKACDRCYLLFHVMQLSLLTSFLLLLLFGVEDKAVGRLNHIVGYHSLFRSSFYVWESQLIVMCMEKLSFSFCASCFEGYAVLVWNDHRLACPCSKWQLPK